MSKGKKYRFHLQKGETLIKKGAMDYCITGKFTHSAMGNVWLTDKRFYFGADLKSGDYLYFEIPLEEINEVGKVGIPVLTRSIQLTTDGRKYRLNVFPMGGWLKKIRAATEAVRNGE